MEQKIRVALQGFSRDLSVANGSYDPVELGEMSADQFYQLLMRIKHARIPAVSSQAGQDLCPPVATASWGNQLHAFEMQGGTILYSNRNLVVSEVDAVNWVLTGQQPAQSAVSAAKPAKKAKPDPYAWGSEHVDIKGLTPVRKHHLPPTDLVNTEAATINTQAGPSISENIIRTNRSKNLYIVPLLFGILALVLAAGYFAVAEPLAGAVTLVFVVCMIALTIYFKKRARGLFLLGFDWNKNVVWAKMAEDRKPVYSNHASCITGFSLSRRSETSSRLQRLGSPSAPMFAYVKDKYDYWDLWVEKSNGRHLPLFSFHSEQDALNVYQKAQWLLSQQI